MAGLVVQEWLAPNGGSERVVREMLDTYPEAELFTLWSDSRSFDDVLVRESWIARTPLRRHKAAAVPAMIPTWRRIPSDKRYDWVLASSHLFAHHARLKSQPDAKKLVYAHTPARYIWEPSLDERGDSAAVRLASATLRPLDKRRAREATVIAANSEFTRARIARTWGRDATVMYPPVDTTKIRAVSDWSLRLTHKESELLETLPDRDFLLGASRFVEYKRLELVIAAGEAAGVPVVLAGSGPDEQRLRVVALDASVPVTFIDSPSDELLYALYQRSLVFVFPAIEDFGIMPVEAMAAGAPVVAMSRGGVAESIGITGGGIALEELTPDAWKDAISRAAGMDRRVISERSDIFARARFRSELADWLDRHVH